MSRARSSVLFIHGLWLHPSSWAPWLRLFGERGYDPSVPGWPGVANTVEDTRANPDPVANRGIEEVADWYTRIIDRMPGRPVVIGHSFGGLIAEMLLAQGRAAAAITISAAHVDGVPWLPFAPLRDRLPLFSDPTNRNRAISLTAEQFRESFGNAVEEQESDELYERWFIPAPSRPLFEAAEEKLALHLPYSPMRDEGRPITIVRRAGGKGSDCPAGPQRVGLGTGHALGDHGRGRVRRPWTLADDRQRLARDCRNLHRLVVERTQSMTPWALASAGKTRRREGAFRPHGSVPSRAAGSRNFDAPDRRVCACGIEAQSSAQRRYVRWLELWDYAMRQLKLR
jgi:pimeloyl-ACP methyl ester carboxylesterase